MMIALAPAAERIETGCYAKFRIYTRDIALYMDAYTQALDALVEGRIPLVVRPYPQAGEDLLPKPNESP